MFVVIGPLYTLLTWLEWSLESRLTPSQQDGKNVSALSRRQAIGGRLLVLGESLSLKHTCWIACWAMLFGSKVLNMALAVDTTNMQ